MKFYNYIIENILVPRNLEGRQEKLRQERIKLLSQEVIKGDLTIDESFEGIPYELVKVKEIKGDVILHNLGYIPSWLKDVKISNSFFCYYSNLSSLEGCPKYIGRNFFCNDNKLTSLEGCPEYIGRNFYCSYNNLTSLEGCPNYIGNDFFCQNQDSGKILQLPKDIILKGKFINYYDYNNDKYLYIKENILVPRNIEDRKEKLRQHNIKLLGQEVIDGDFEIDKSLLDIPKELVKVKEINGDVFIFQLDVFPEWMKDIKIYGDLDISAKRFKSLKNCPKYIEGNFSASHNNLTDLKYFPEYIGNNIDLSSNDLEDIQGLPEKVNNSLYVDNNKLRSLEGCSKHVNGNFDCRENKLWKLDNCPKYVGKDLICFDNMKKLELPEGVEVKGKFRNIE